MPNEPAASTIDFDRIWERMTSHFSLSEWSLHGPDHWRRVERNGLQIAEQDGADLAIVRLFAVFHDAERWNEGFDPEHGRRAARLAESLRGELFDLEPGRMELLVEALSYHNDGLTSDSPTIGACWDADRLDLPRVGIRPLPHYMSTPTGRRLAVDFQ